MYKIKNDSLITAHIFYNNQLVSTYDFTSHNDLQFEIADHCGGSECECCDGIKIRFVDTEYSQRIGLTVTYETHIQNIAGFENCSTRKQAGDLIYRKICDHSGIAYEVREASLIPALLRKPDQSNSDQL